MVEHTDTSVVIVGAGPVGLTAALLLARHGVQSVVVDARRSASVEGSKAICIQRDSLDICDRVGVANAMISEGVTWSVGRTYFRDEELFHIDLPTDATTKYPPFVNISQASTESFLVDQAHNNELIDLRYASPVANVSQRADDVTVTLETGSTLTASYCIGADGARSVVRKAIGASFDGMSFDEQFLIADIRCDLGFGNERRFFFDPSWNPGRQVLVHPCPDGVWRIDWQVPAEFDLEAEQSSGALDARIKQITGDKPYVPVWLSVYRFHQRRASTFHRDRVVLCGDSSHIYAPFGARGLNAGFHDAENAAWKIAAVLNGWGGPHLLRSFAIEREAAADENLAVTTETMRFLVPDDDDAMQHRLSILDGARTDPSLRPLVNSGRLAEPYWYNASPLTTNGTLEGFPTAPGQPRPVVSGVLARDAPIAHNAQRLRALFGAHFVVMHHGPTPPSLDVKAPVHTVSLTDIDPSGKLAPVFSLPSTHAAVIRPDGYIAAIVPISELSDAITRATGW